MDCGCPESVNVAVVWPSVPSRPKPIEPGGVQVGQPRAADHIRPRVPEVRGGGELGAAASPPQGIAGWRSSRTSGATPPPGPLKVVLPVHGSGVAVGDRREGLVDLVVPVASRVGDGVRACARDGPVLDAPVADLLPAAGAAAWSWPCLTSGFRPRTRERAGGGPGLSLRRVDPVGERLGSSQQRGWRWPDPVPAATIPPTMAQVVSTSPPTDAVEQIACSKSV